MAETPGRVLVCDDENFFREAIRDILSGEGLDVVEASDGETALELARDPSIGVAILDIRLPGIDGIEVLRQLRESRPELHVIMLSAHTDQELVLDALRLGACDYLAKPLHDEELVLAVGRAAQSFRLSDDWGRLRGRVDRLAGQLENLSQRASEATGEELRRGVARSATDAAADVLEATKTSLLLVDDAGRELHLAAALGRSFDMAEIETVPVGEGVAGVAFERGEPIVVTDLATDERFDAGDSPRYESTSFVVAPVARAGRGIGVLCATDRAGGGSFDGDDLALLRLLAGHVAEVLEGARASEAALASGALPSQLPSDSQSQIEPFDSTEFDTPGEAILGLAPSVSAGSLEADEDASDSASQSGAGLDDFDELDDFAELAEQGGTERAAFDRAELDDAERDAELVRSVCEAITNEVSPDRIFAAALRPLAEGLRAAPASIFLIDAEHGVLRCESSCDGGLRDEREELSTTGGLTGSVLQTGRMVASDTPEADGRFDAEIDTPADGTIGPMLCVPLSLRGKVIGVFRAFPTPAASSVAQRRTPLASARSGELIGPALSAAVRNALLYRSLLESIDEVAEARRAARS